MKVKFIKKMLAVLCVASMSMSCVAGSVGAIEFVKGFEGVDVEGTQKYAKKLNKSIQNLKEKLYDCKDLIELKLGKKQLDEKRRDQLKEQLKLRDEQNKRNELKKQRLIQREADFRSAESLLNNRLQELQQEQNQIYKIEFNLEKANLEKRKSDFDLKFHKFENELGQYGRIVKQTYNADMDEGNSVTYKIVLRSERPERPEKPVEVTLEGYNVVEQNPQQIELLKSLKLQIDKWMDLIERLDKVQFVKAIQLNDDLHLQLDMKADVTISGVINMIKESCLYEGVNKIFEDNYNNLFNTINIYLDEYVILSGNSDTNFNLREREAKERLEREKKVKKPENDKKKKKIVKKKVVKKKSLNEHNKNLNNILNQIDVLSKEIQQAENFKLECLRCCNEKISELNQKIQNLRQSRKSAKSVGGNEGIKLRNGILKDIKAIKAEKLKLKAKMEKDIANLEKQIQDKRTKKADLEKQVYNILG